jgi:peroxiredoxin
VATLKAGVRAPEFILSDLDQARVALDPAASPLTLAIFFKTTCPTCQYAWPYYERLHNTYAGDGLRVLGISQHDRQSTARYKAEFGGSFPHLIDDAFRVSRAYDPAFVPTGFLIDPHGDIIETFTSWDSAGLNDLSEHIARRLQVPNRRIVRPEDNAIESKRG